MNAILNDQSSCDASGIIDNIPQTDSMDNLLANLAEDNANSLPSAVDATEFDLNILVEEKLQKDGLMEIDENNKIEDGEEKVVQLKSESEIVDATKIETEDEEVKSNDNAIAEDLQNGENSQDTRVEVDTEMVSEDELPAPTKEKVDDAEELSDDELPAPQRAELPEDTEVVSEDELPSTKTKRKLDDGYDPGSPTEDTEGPEKKAKIEDGKHQNQFFF